MKLSFFQRRRLLRPAFTLVELLVVIAIIALLAGLAMPNMQLGIRKAQSVQCSEQLRGIGAAVLSYATDNNDMLPEINQAAAPVYPPSVLGIVGVLGIYGVSTNTTECPVDIQSGPSSSFAQYGSSYEWNPVLDDGTDPVTAIAIGPIPITVNASRIRVCTDFVAIHSGKMNALYADGHSKPR